MRSSGEGGLVVEQVADWQEPLVQRAEQCARSITYVAGELIRERFLLGGIVAEALERSQYGDAVIVKIAYRMSTAVGKCIRPHMLYESARIYSAFGGQWERIEALRTGSDCVNRGVPGAHVTTVLQQSVAQPVLESFLGVSSPVF